MTRADAGLTFWALTSASSKQAVRLYFEPLYRIAIWVRTWRGLSRESWEFKRAMDVAGSLLALLILGPVFLAIAVAIKLTSQGPVFVRQERVGQYGRPFTFLKFRSMYTGDYPAYRAYVKSLAREVASHLASFERQNERTHLFKRLTNDPRITPLGRILRETSLDELPQFINVLKGDMSLVGPRPAVPYEVQYYESWHHQRFAVKPGITGLWQVAGGRSRTKLNDMVCMDLEYARSRSLWLDIKILLNTPRAVLTGEGAYLDSEWFVAPPRTLRAVYARRLMIWARHSSEDAYLDIESFEAPPRVSQSPVCS